MRKNFQIYFGILAQKHFLVLILTVLLGQIASAFLLLSLVTSVFVKTGSDFGVSGVILSLAVPALLLMALAGIVSDLVDRKILIVATNVFITLVVLVLLLVLDRVYLSILLSFLYFAGNSFFFPAVSAATAQLVKRNQLLYANSLFFLSLAGGQIVGLLIAAIIQFFFGNNVLLYLCEVLLVVAAIIPLFLPRLIPKRGNGMTVVFRMREIFKFLVYIFGAKTTWFYFLVFASMQGIIAFGVTLAPGFFSSVVGLNIYKSPLFIFPPIALGIILGVLFTHRPKIRESFLVKFGFGIIGLFTAVIGIASGAIDIKSVLMIFSTVFLIASGFGVIIIMIAARTVLQKRVAHEFQGTIFGANFVVSSFFATVMSPLAATLVALFGYANVFLFWGLIFMAFSVVIAQMLKKWSF